MVRSHCFYQTPPVVFNFIFYAQRKRFDQKYSKYFTTLQWNFLLYPFYFSTTISFDFRSFFLYIISIVLKFMTEIKHNIQLDPHGQSEGVWEFTDFFKLRAQKPSLLFLEDILQHYANIPYENVSKIIKLNQYHHQRGPIIRLPAEVMHEHISHKLGGTCFSLTFFLHSILAQHGFDTYPVMADMRAGRNIHCCLIVVLDEVKYLVDPGYLLTRPMELNPTKPRLFRGEFTGVELRYHVQNQHYDLFTFDKMSTKWRYRFQDRPVPPEEFLQHWLASFGWNSMNGLCLTRIMPGGLLYVRKNFMRETTFQGKKNHNIRKNYHASIQEYFGIDPQVIEQARAALTENLAMKMANGEKDAPEKWLLKPVT